MAEVGKTMMEARAAFPGLQIASTAFGQALAQKQLELSWEQLKTQKEMFVVEQKRADEEAILDAAIVQWAAKMKALTQGSGKIREFPYNEELRAIEHKRDLLTDVDKIINTATIGTYGDSRSFGPRLNLYKQAMQQGDMSLADETLKKLGQYYTEPKTINEAFSSVKGIFGTEPGISNIDGVLENIKIAVSPDSPMASIASTALNNAKQRFTGESRVSPTGEANFITQQKARFGKDPDWWGWTQKNMPTFIRHLLVELSDRLNEKLDAGTLTEPESLVLNRLNAMGGDWNKYARDFTESIMNPGMNRNQGNAALVDEVLGYAGISADIFGFVNPEHMQAIPMLQEYSRVETLERGMVQDYAGEYPRQFQEYAALKNAVGMIDQKTNMGYLMNLDDLRKMQLFEYENRMEQTGLNIIRDFESMGLLDRAVEYSPGVTAETHKSYIRDIADAVTMGETERAREILMGKPGEFEGYIDLWFDNEKVTPDFIADFTEFFYRHGALESPNPLDVSNIAERYRALDIFTEEELKEARKFSAQKYPGGGAIAILEFLKRGKK